MENVPPASAANSASGGSNLFTALYADLRDLAERQLRRSSVAVLSPTTLLHEAYIGMASRHIEFPDRGRFLGYAARVMRGLIIDYVREKRALKRGSGYEITRLPTEPAVGEPDDCELSRLSDALDVLASSEPRLAEVVDLKYFCGYSFEEIAAQRGISERTVQRDWEKARLLLFDHLQGPL